MPIPDRLKRLRAERGLSQAGLARKAGVAQQLISQLESGMNGSTKRLPEIARALGVRPHDIDENYSADTPEAVAAPLISWVSAGALAAPDIAIETEDAPIMLEPDLDPNGDWIALRVDGDSMNKVSPHNSIIFVNRRERRLVAGAYYVIGDGNGGATYKRFQPPSTWEPCSTNPAYKPLVLPLDVDPDIIGRVRKSVIKF
jgi:transcriptional regulator with XRE-family HTH domain